MYITHESQEQLKQEILHILNRHLNLNEYAVFFFGSRVKNRDDRSDIDVGIEGEKPVPTSAWQKIQEEIDDMRTLYTIDCVDFKRVSQEFREVALQHIEPIHNSLF